MFSGNTKYDNPYKSNKIYSTYSFSVLHVAFLYTESVKFTGKFIFIC